jgi:hypothetical protein
MTLHYAVRLITAWILSRFMKHTGFRFSKHYRWGTTWYHRFVYSCVSTVAANYYADGAKFSSFYKA